MSILSSSEKQLAQQIIEAGYISAARSFSDVAQQQVSIKTAGVEIFASNCEKFSVETSGMVSLLTTEIIGDIQGKSYLLLTEAESKAIFDTCLSSGGSADERQVMEEAIIKELDNIISAAVITEFSNVLQISIYGGVPQLAIGTAEEVQLLVLDDFTDQNHDDIYLFANTRFVFEKNTTLQPRFFWKFHPNLVQSIKTQASAQYQ